MSAAESARPEPGFDATKAEIAADAERTRHELGATAAAVAAKLDVPEQARQKVAETKQRVAHKTEPARRNAVPIVAAVAVVVAGLLIWRRRRR